MPDVAPHLKLTEEGALKILHAAREKAAAMGVSQCIAVVDDGGHLVGAIGVGSGTGEQDLEVARAGLAALKA